LVAAVALGSLLGGSLVLQSFIRSMLYPAPPVRVPATPPSPLVDVPLVAGGERLSAWWLPAERPGAPVLLMLHGNGENLETMRQSGLFADFAQLGVGVLAVDYPGYGRSAGLPGELRNVAAAEAGWEWLRAHQAERPHAVVGWSLGAAVATQLAARRGREVAGLILLSPWDDLAGVAKVHFPGLLVGLLDERYDTVEAARRIACPCLVVHGDRDDIIPIDLGRRAHAALPEPKRWVAVAGAGHNDLLARGEAWEAIAGLLDDLPPASPPIP
jgi:pimeloyl-ACP methyl ester carboxylesterase